MTTTLRTHISNIVSTMALVVLPANLAWAEGGSASGGFADLIPLLFIFVIFWFFLIRPQQKKLKAHGEMIQALKKGDKVITGGGLFGEVMDVKENFVKVEIAEGVRVKVKQETILDLVPTETSNN
ncbi:MAG: preprotein translocase subunit YajC [Ghiorsea sp.]